LCPRQRTAASGNSAEVSATPRRPAQFFLNISTLPDFHAALAWTNLSASLYSTFSLTPPINWAPVTNTPIPTNGGWTVILPARHEWAKRFIGCSEALSIRCPQRAVVAGMGTPKVSDDVIASSHSGRVEDNAPYHVGE